MPARRKPATPPGFAVQGGSSPAPAAGTPSAPVVPPHGASGLADRTSSTSPHPTGASPGALRVRDLVDIAPVQTVVRLADLEDPARRTDLESSFVLTADAEHCLRTVLRDVRSGRGRGYFLEGAFGSGKSHLMAVLHGLLGGRLAPRRLGAGLGEGVAGRAAALDPAELPERPLLTVAVSLVEFSSRETLEQAVLRGVAAAGGPRLLDPASPAGVPPRQEAFAALTEHMVRSGAGGLLLCVDELSEFLRSKPDGRAFSEDVRFLQFLGEWAERAPAWIVCSAQEAIEQAGDLPAPVFSRIRDRYPVRFRLGGGHIKELIARRLVRHLPAAADALPRLYASLRRTFGTLPFSEDEFVRLYPVHPMTVDLLDQLRPLFSERRGVIDFVVARLAGSPARRIAPFLDQPADRLLTPDALVEHFHDRVRERPETAPLVNVALPYFERELTRVLPDEETARLAASLGRVLIAGALCPTPRAFSARELADALLFRLTDLDPQLNLAFVAETLERMVTAGAYVGRREEPAPAAPGAGAAPVVRYFCDLEADLSLIVARRLDYWRSGLLPDDGRTWTALLPWCEDPAMPLQRLSEQPRSTWEISWRRTPRRVLVWLVQVSAVQPEEVREVARSLETSETDAAVVIAAAQPGEAESAAARWEREVAPLLLALRPELPVLLWTPRAPAPAEVERLREAVAYVLLEAEVGADRGAHAERLAAHLREGAAARRREVSQLYAALYLQGSLRDLDGNVCGLGELATRPFPALLEAVCDEPLRRRFPLHPDLPARPDLLVPAAVERAVGELVRGETGGEAPLDAAARAVLDQFLVPLGLCRRSARGYRLTVDPRACPLAGDLMSALEPATPASPLPLAEAYGRLRKGPAGLHRRVFELLCYTLVQSGAVSAVRGARRLPPAHVRLQNLWEVEGLAPGALVDPDLQAGLETLPFLPPRLRRGPLTYALQREAWETAVEWKRQWTAALPVMRAEIRGVEGFPSLASILTDDLLADLQRLEDLLASVTPSLPPQEGMQRLLEAFAARPSAPRTLQRVTALREFLAHRLSGYMNMVGYLDSEGFAPPPALREQARDLRRMLRDQEAVLGEGFPQLEEAFGALRQAYADAYAVAHAATVGPEAFAAHEAVEAGAAYRLAAVLGEVPGLQVQPDAVTLRQALRAALAARCAEGGPALADRLRRLPCCACGFRLDRPPSPPPAAEIAGLAAASAAAYLSALQAPEHAERLRAYAAGLEAVGRRPAAEALTGLLALPPAGPEAAERALELIARAGATELRSALAGQALVVERDGAALLARLSGRAVRREQVLRTVEEWLGEVEPGTFVRVTAAAVTGAVTATATPASDPRGALGAGHGSTADALPFGPAVRPAAAVDASAHVALSGSGVPPGAPDGVHAHPPLRAAPSGPGQGPAAAAVAAAAQRCRQSLAALSAAAAAPPSGPGEWEGLWLGAAGRWARHLEEARDAARAAGASGELPLARWRAAAAEAHSALQRAFAAQLHRLAPDARGGLGPAVLRAREECAAARGRYGVHLWCLDGMRCDLLDVVVDTLARGGLDLEELARGVGWAAAPTTTAVQFEALRNVGFRGELIRWDEGVEEALAADARQVLDEVDWTRATGDGCICKWDFIDAKVHASPDDFGTFCAEVRVQAARRLLPAAAALRPGDRVVLCSDHGFRVAVAPGSEGPRYLHGGESPDEVLSPWCLLRVR